MRYVVSTEVSCKLCQYKLCTLCFTRWYIRRGRFNLHKNIDATELIIHHLFLICVLNLLEVASGMHPEWQGGAFKAPPPIKNQFRGHFDPIF